MEIKGFLLEPKKGISIEAVKSKLEELVGEYHVSLVTVGDKEEPIIMQNAFGKTELYDIKINATKKGAVAALICEPWYDKLVNPATKKAVIPKELAPYLKKIKACSIEASMYGTQG